MNLPARLCVLACLGAGVAVAGTSPDQSPAKAREKLEQGEFLELTAADLENALKLYRGVAEDQQVPPALRARAYLNIGGAERKRGNLQAAVTALQQVLTVGPAGAPEGKLAERLLQRLQGGSEAGGLHDWHTTLLENEKVRAELYRLVTQVASPDAGAAAQATRKLRAYGTVALPVLRGALRTARGGYRLALLRAAAEGGDWNQLPELARQRPPDHLENFVSTVLSWPRQRRDRLVRFLRAQPAEELPRARRSYLLLAAGDHTDLAGMLAAVGEDKNLGAHLEKILQLLLAEHAGAAAPLTAYLLEQETVPLAAARPLLQHAGGALHGTLLRKVYREHGRVVLDLLQKAEELRVIAGLVREEGLPHDTEPDTIMAWFVPGETWNTAAWDHLGNDGTPGLVEALADLLVRWPQYRGFWALYELCLQTDRALPHLERVIRSLWKQFSDDFVQRNISVKRRGRVSPLRWYPSSYRTSWGGQEIFPSDPPPTPARADLWKRLFLTAPKPWKSWALELIAPDLPWMPDLLSEVAPLLKVPEFLSGDPEADLTLHNHTLKLLKSFATRTLPGGRQPDAEDESRLEAFRRGVLKIIDEDFQRAWQHLEDSGTKSVNPGDEDLWRTYQRLHDLSRGSRSSSRRPPPSLAYQRFLNHWISPLHADYRPTLLEQHIHGAITSPIVTLAFVKSLDNAKSPDDYWNVITPIVSRLERIEAGSTDGLVVILADAFRRRESSGFRDSERTVLEHAGPWRSLEDEALRPAFRILEPAAEEPTTRERRRRLARLLRRAVEDRRLRSSTRACAFTALPLASLEAFAAVCADERVFVSTPREQRARTTAPATLTPSFSEAILLLEFLPAGDRPGALHALAATGHPEKIALAVRLGAHLNAAAGGSLPEAERLDWIAELIELASAGEGLAVNVLSSCLETLTRRTPERTAALVQQVLQMEVADANEAARLRSTVINMADALLLPNALEVENVRLAPGPGSRSRRQTTVPEKLEELKANLKLLERWKKPPGGQPSKLPETQPASGKEVRDDP